MNILPVLSSSMFTIPSVFKLYRGLKLKTDLVYVMAIDLFFIALLKWLLYINLKQKSATSEALIKYGKYY